MKLIDDYMDLNDSDLWIGIAAGYQVCGWSRANIAEATGTTPDTVWRNFEAVAKHIGLTPRQAPDDPTWTVERIRDGIERIRTALKEMKLDQE